MTYGCRAPFVSSRVSVSDFSVSEGEVVLGRESGWSDEGPMAGAVGSRVKGAGAGSIEGLGGDCEGASVCVCGGLGGVEGEGRACVGSSWGDDGNRAVDVGSDDALTASPSDVCACCAKSLNSIGDEFAGPWSECCH